MTAQQLAFVKQTLKIQYERVKLNATFKREAAYIAQLAAKAGATKLADFGCWTGLLAAETFAVWPSLQQYYGVEAVPIFAEFARSVLADKPAEFIEATLVPRLMNLPEVTTIKVNPYDTLNTASILAKPANATLVDVPVASNTYITPFVRAHGKLFDNDVYVKVDLDGVDIALVETLLAEGRTPAVIQFEVWGRFYNRGLPEVIAQLNGAGYNWPEALDYRAYTHFSIALTKDHGWWFVGYSPSPYNKAIVLSEYKAEI